MDNNKLKLTEIGTDEYHAIKYLEVPISTDNIFVNDEQIFSDDFFDKENCDKDFIKSLLPVGSSVYMPIIKDSDSMPTKYSIIGVFYDIDLLCHTVTIALYAHKAKEEINNILSEIDNDTFHYYACLNMYTRLKDLKLVRDTRKEANVSLLRISRHDDEMKSKDKIEHDSKQDLSFSQNAVIANDLDKTINKIIEMTKIPSGMLLYKVSRANKVTVLTHRTTPDPLTCMGEMAGVCWGADTSDPKKNYKRGLSCLKANHGRVLEYAQVYMILHDSSIKVFRDYYTHIGGDPTRLQDSTRRKDMTTDFKYITPHTIAANPEALKIFTDQMESARQAEIKLEKLGIPREDASGVLPLETDSTICVRTNLRQLIDMSHQRMCTKAYWEFREIMDDMIKQLRTISDEWKYIVDNYFVPKCEVLGYCPEDKSCGRKPKKD